VIPLTGINLLMKNAITIINKIHSIIFMLTTPFY
jgi:hypothetical protein